MLAKNIYSTLTRKRFATTVTRKMQIPDQSLKDHDPELYGLI